MTNLTHVNAAPAQTWNWLRMNERTLEMPALSGIDSKDALVAAGVKRTPELFRSFLSGSGTQVGAWIDVASDTRELFEVGAKTSETFTVLLGDTACVEQLCVHVREGAKAHIVLGAGASSLTASNVRVRLDAGAACAYTMLAAKERAGRHIDSFSATLAAGAKLQVQQYVLGSELALCGTQVELLGEGASYEQTIRYIGEQNHEIDLTSTCIHIGKNTTSEIVATGVLDSGSHKVFRATIDLSRGCKGAVGSEQETVVCAGEDVVNKTLPVILCSEDDVAGNHGATIGSLSNKQLFYLASRGISPDEAIDLLKTSTLSEASSVLPEAFGALVQRWAEHA